MATENKTLGHFLLRTKVELLIRKRKLDKKMFETEVALSNVIFAIDEVLKLEETNDGDAGS